MAKLRINQDISIDEAELSEKFVRSSGPGGQNVNKVSTAVHLRFDIANCEDLPQRVRTKILKSGDSRVTKEGELVIFAESNRTREANRKEARDRLKQIIRKAAFVPKKRIPTRPTLGSQKKRLETKSKRSSIKRSRSGKIDLD